MRSSPNLARRVNSHPNATKNYTTLLIEQWNDTGSVGVKFLVFFSYESEITVAFTTRQRYRATFSHFEETEFFNAPMCSFVMFINYCNKIKRWLNASRNIHKEAHCSYCRRHPAFFFRGFYDAGTCAKMSEFCVRSHRLNKQLTGLYSSIPFTLLGVGLDVCNLISWRYLSSRRCTTSFRPSPYFT